MTTATLSPTRDLLLPSFGIALGMGAWAALTGVISTDVLTTPPGPAILCCALFGSFAAIALAQRPRETATPRVVVKVEPRQGAEARVGASPVMVPATKKAA